ncbi:MAG: XRE family transcriptional regulator [Candidatus Hydrothermales bacterium]
MEDLGKKIRELRKGKGLTQRELANLLGYKLLAISRWERNERRPSLRDLKRLSSIFNVSVNYFFDEESIIRLALMGKVGAGKKALYYDPIKKEREIEIPLFFLPWRLKDKILRNKENYFVLQVSSDSMEPLINEGDFVIVERGRFDSHDIVVVRIGSSEFVVKKLLKKNNQFFLLSYNKRYGVFELNEEAEIIGRVVFLLSFKSFY